MKPLENKSLKDIEGEEWRSIPTFHDSYRISNFGRIKRIENTVSIGLGRVQKLPTKILSSSFSKLRKYKTELYLMLVLKKAGGGKMTTYIHRLVALAFVENRYNKPHVNHKDGNTLNNKPENLEWVTNQENIIHAHKNGLVNTAVGENAPKAKINNEQALIIAFSKKSNPELARQYGINTSMISGIKTGRYWAHLTGITFTPKKYIKNEHS